MTDFTTTLRTGITGAATRMNEALGGIVDTPIAFTDPTKPTLEELITGYARIKENETFLNAAMTSKQFLNSAAGYYEIQARLMS
jgi:hypothetical protein